MIVGSVIFILIVTMLHVVGKVRKTSSSLSLCCLLWTPIHGVLLYGASKQWMTVLVHMQITK